MHQSTPVIVHMAYNTAADDDDDDCIQNYGPSEI